MTVFVVVDASVVAAWYLPNEADPVAEAALGRLEQDSAAVPFIWPAEVANAFLQAEKRGRLQAAQRVSALAELTTLPLEIDAPDPVRVWTQAYPLAQRHGLTLYDALYLELAVRRGLSLATLDRRLGRAASDAGVALWTASAGEEP